VLQFLCPFICRNRLPEAILVYKAMTCQKCEEGKEFTLDSLFPQAPRVLLRESAHLVCAATISFSSEVLLYKSSVID